MASQRVADILRSRSAPFTEDQIQMMTDRVGWSWIYGDDKTREKFKAPTPPEICFTGFPDKEKERLCVIALDAGLLVKDSVTKKLALLVTGAFAGPSKLIKAEQQGCTITDEAGFLEFIRSRKPS
jgi:NAD-dependent DNA ligase